MSDSDEAALGQLVQSYIRAKSGPTPDSAAAAALAARLDRALVDQVDALGSDADRLLRVDPAAVLAEIQVLEREAAREDARATSAAARGHDRGAESGNGRAPARGGPRPRRPGQPAGGQRRRPRSQR